MGVELIKYGVEVFNGDEDMFNRWLYKYNNYVQTFPYKLTDEMLKRELDRIEYSNFN